ncbi:hypothetical protein AAHH80_35375, partial [Burkholderia pseudomallei]
LSIAAPTVVLVAVVPFALYDVYVGAEIAPVAGSYVAPPPSAAAVLLPWFVVFVVIELMLVVSEPMPVEADVESDARLLLVALM